MFMKSESPCTTLSYYECYEFYYVRCLLHKFNRGRQVGNSLKCPCLYYVSLSGEILVLFSMKLFRCKIRCELL